MPTTKKKTAQEDENPPHLNFRHIYYLQEIFALD